MKCPWPLGSGIDEPCRSLPSQGISWFYDNLPRSQWYSQASFLQTQTTSLGAEEIHLSWLFQHRREVWNTYSLGSLAVTGQTPREGSQSWLNTALTELPMESPQFTFYHSLSEAGHGRRCSQHPHLSAPFQQLKKKKGCCFTAMKTSSIITDSELNPSSKLLALAHLLLQNTRVHLFLKQESTRNSSVFYMVFRRAGIQVKRFRKWVCQYCDGKHLTLNSSQWYPTHEHQRAQWPHHKTLGKTAGRLILLMSPPCQSPK